MESGQARLVPMDVTSTKFIVGALTVAASGLVTISCGRAEGLPLLVAGLTGFALHRSFVADAAGRS